METYSVVTIICPNCGTALEPADDTCHRCGANTSSGAGNCAAPRPPLMDRPWLLIVVLLHVGVLGIPLYWKTKHPLPVRLAFIGASIVYTVFAVFVIVWGSMFIVGRIRLLG